MSGPDFSQFSMQDLFRIEAENQVRILTAGLLALSAMPRRRCIWKPACARRIR